MSKRPQRDSSVDAFKLLDGHTPNQVILEMAIAENNFDVIMDTAEEMIRSSLLFHDVSDPPGMIKPLRDLVTNIKLIFSVIRRDLKSIYPTVNFGRGKVAPAGEKRPNIQPNNFKPQRTLCPLVLLFRIIAQGLSLYNIRVRENSWGPIRPLHELLLRLQDRIQKQQSEDGDKFWPGLSTCIMFHEYDSKFTIASSTPRYGYLQGLASLARTVRRDHLTRLGAQVSPSDTARIKAVERLCKQVTRNISQNPFQNSASRTQVDGVGATFQPDGEYMPACFLDFWRFDMTRPAETRELERVDLDRPVYGVDSCAEWELWVIGMSKLNIMPKTKLRNHPLIATRETFPPKVNPPPRGQVPNPLRGVKSYGR